MRLKSIPLKYIVLAGISHFACAQNGSATVNTPRAVVRADRSANDKVEIIKELSSSFEDIAQRAGQGVVQIFARTYSTDNADNNNPVLTSENSTSSGVIVSADGYILTNAHAVRGAHNIRVRIAPSSEVQVNPSLAETLKATLVGVDDETDLAVIKVKGTDLPHVSFGDSDRLKQGQLVLALGNPLGLENSVSLGVVSATARQLKPDDPMVYIQTDAPINPGNSGGPLLDADGRIVGINTFILTQSGGSEGIGFAIPSNIAQQIYKQLRTNGCVRRARLGIVAQTIGPTMTAGLDLEAAHGVIVSDVDEEGPAATAGIKTDDVIRAINAVRVLTVSQLEANVYRQQPGTMVTLHIMRGGEQLDIPVKTDEEPDELRNLTTGLDPVTNAVTELGIVGLDISKPVLHVLPDLRRPQGVLVAVRSADMPYSGPPLQVGDAIYEINRHVVTTVAELRHTLGAMKPGDAVVMLIERNGRLLYIPLELG